MQPDFWHARWASNQIGFHEPQANSNLTAHFDALAVSAGARVFVPLCGKTLDIDWLLARGCRVAGVELSTLAVAQLFERFDAQPVVTTVGSLQCHSISGLDVFVGDLFALTPAQLGPIDAVYDRAALIALPEEMRWRYGAQMSRLVNAAPQLVVTLEYDQKVAEGPPFSVSAEALRVHFAPRQPKLLSRQELATGMKGKYPAVESTWLVS